MGRKGKAKGEYNDFLDGEKLRDNKEIRTGLGNTENSHKTAKSAKRDISPPALRSERQMRPKRGKSGPKKPPLTHFLCLPLVTEKSRPQLAETLSNFRQEVDRLDLVPAKAVRPVGTLHLTLGVMSLDKERLEEAGRFLNNTNVEAMLRQSLPSATSDTAEPTAPLSIDLHSLIPMHDPGKTSILYAEPRDNSERLYPFALALRNMFVENGFLVEDTRPLKLHATVLNTIYAKGREKMGHGRGGGSKGEHVRADGERTAETGSSRQPANHSSEHQDASDQPGPVETAAPQAPDTSQGHGPNAKSWLKFDASDLIERYRDFVWAEEVCVDRVQVCRMGARKVGVEGADGVVDEVYEVVFEKRLVGRD